MNICQTQPLAMMQVEKMKVELKDGHKGIKAKRTSRVIPVPLAMREQTKNDLDSAVKMGILEDVSGLANHDRTRTINNKTLTNLRRKCDGFIFKC